MKLNKKGRDELRILVEKELKQVPDGTRISLDKSLLELLLFETIIYKRNPKGIVKLPVWSGPFLQKIDLSEVSFEDVSWTLLGEGENSALGKETFDQDCWQQFLCYYGKSNNSRVEYSRTNIQVDFNISWEMKVRKELGVGIANCDFSYVDLSLVDTTYFRNIRKSNFSNTNLELEQSLKDIKSPIFYYTDLSGNNLGNFIIRLIDIVTKGGPLIGLGCNLSGTRISILLEKDKFKDKKVQANLKTILAGGDLDGCFINGKRVISLEEKKKIAQQKLKEYEKFKVDTFNAVAKVIQKQKR